MHATAHRFCKYLALLLLFSSSCSQEDPTRANVAGIATGPVVASKLSELEQSFAADLAEPQHGEPRDQRLESPSLEGDPLAERVRECLPGIMGAQDLAQDPARAELLNLGARAVPTLALSLNDSNLPAPLREQTLRVLAEMDSPQAAGALLIRCAEAREPWERSRCAWLLSSTQQAWVVPGLLRCLFRESDPEARVWLAHSLAMHGNGAGLQILIDAMQADPQGPLFAIAQPLVQELCEEAGSDTEQVPTDGSSADQGRALLERVIELNSEWLALEAVPSAQFPAPKLDGNSPTDLRFRFEVWDSIEHLRRPEKVAAQEAAFALANLGPAVAPALAQTLGDESSTLRAEAARCLAAMGLHARAAVPQLLEALNDFSAAPQAALALGRMPWPPAQPQLEQAAQAGPGLELRVAGTQALGALGLESSQPLLRKLMQGDEPEVVRQAASEALALCGDFETASAALLSFADSPRVDGTSTMWVLEQCLQRASERGNNAAREVLLKWQQANANAPALPNSTALLTGRADQLAQLRAALPRILEGP